MIHGIGTDIVRVERLAAMWQKHGERALDKLLAADELAAFAAAADKGRFLAKRFAAKEAFAKALGSGVREPATLPNIAVGHDPLGKPQLHFHGQLAELVKNLGLTAHLSISDEAEYAVAYVLLERA